MALKQEKNYIWLIPPITQEDLKMLQEKYGVKLEGNTETWKQMTEATGDLYPQPRANWEDALENWWWKHIQRGKPSEVGGKPYDQVPIRIEISAQPESEQQTTGSAPGEGGGIGNSQRSEPGFNSEDNLAASLSSLQDYKDRELAIVKESEQQRHQVEKHFSELTRKTKQQNLAAEIGAFQSAAGSMAKSLGLGIKQQALIMIPFEIAQATKEMGEFLATKDPAHLAASIKHALAVKQYADAAKSSAPAGSSGSSSGGSAPAASGSEPKEPVDRRARVVVNVGDGVVVNPKEFTRKLVEGLNEAYRDNVKIEFA